VPRAPGGFGGMDHAISIKAALLIHNEHKGIATEIDRVLSASNPMQTLGPRGDAATFARVALEQGYVKLTALERAASVHAYAASNIQS
jgi:hypothetical protein